jgi:hypothetical protein
VERERGGEGEGVEGGRGKGVAGGTVMILSALQMMIV